MIVIYSNRAVRSQLYSSMTLLLVVYCFSGYVAKHLLLINYCTFIDMRCHDTLIDVKFGACVG